MRATSLPLSYEAGAGDTYRSASYLARREAYGFPVGCDGRIRPTDHWQLVGDWVEVAFDVFAAMSYERERPVFLRIDAFPDASMDNRVRFLHGRALIGQPARVVTDGHDGTINAARYVWPEARMYRSEWHLMRSVEKKLHCSQGARRRQADLFGRPS